MITLSGLLWFIITNFVRQQYLHLIEAGKWRITQFKYTIFCSHKSTSSECCTMIFFSVALQIALFPKVLMTLFPPWGYLKRAVAAAETMADETVFPLIRRCVERRTPPQWRTDGRFQYLSDSFFWTHIFLVPYPIRYGADHKWRHAISDSFWHPLPHRHVFITKTFVLSSRDPWLPPPLSKTLPSLMDDP